MVRKLGVVHILRKHFLLEWKVGGHFLSEVPFLSLADHCGFGLLDPSDAFWALSWVCQGTRMLPTPHLVIPLSKPLSHVPLGCVRPTPGKGEPRPLPHSETLQRWLLRSGDPSAGSALSQGTAQPCMAPGGRGCWKRTGEQESHIHFSRARLLAGGLVSIIC